LLLYHFTIREGKLRGTTCRHSLNEKGEFEKRKVWRTFPKKEREREGGGRLSLETNSLGSAQEFCNKEKRNSQARANPLKNPESRLGRNPRPRKAK